MTDLPEGPPSTSEAPQIEGNHDKKVPSSNANTVKVHAKPSNGRGGGRKEDPPDVRISKTLSYILRHGAAKESLTLRPDGFVRVDDLLKRPKLQKENVDLDTLKRIVAENAKQRFALREEPDPQDSGSAHVLWIRANQGHSVQVEDLELTKIETPEELPVVVHGTFMRHWDAIRKEGLKVMNRHHIHCASGHYGAEGVISGMRATCDLFIEIDVPKAMAGGIVFEKSANGVILTKGKEGTLAPQYFKRITSKQGQEVSL